MKVPPPQLVDDYSVISLMFFSMVDVITSMQLKVIMEGKQYWMVKYQDVYIY